MKLTNNIIIIMLIKLVNAKHNDRDEHSHLELFVYCTIYKFITDQTHFQLVWVTPINAHKIHFASSNNYLKYHY